MSSEIADAFDSIWCLWRLHELGALVDTVMVVSWMPRIYNSISYDYAMKRHAVKNYINMS